MAKIDKKEKRIINLFIQVFGLLTVILGFSAILGWIYDISQLASFDSSKIPMALSSAVLFVAYGLIIFFHNRLPTSRIVAQIGIAFSSAGILAALLLFYISLNDIRSNAEHLWIKMSGTVDGLVIGHMSPVTAFCFLLVGLSFLIMFTKSGQKKLINVSFISSVIVIVISIIFLLSYLFGTPLLYAGSFIPPALTSSLASLILGITLLIMSGLKIWSQEELSDALSTRYSYILALVLIVVIVSVITTGYSYYTSYEKQYRSEIDHQLSSIAELKVSEIVRWRKERIGDAEIFYKNAEFAGLVKRFFNNHNDHDTKKRIQKWIDQVYSAYQYNRISLHDLKGGELVSSPVEKIYQSLFFSKCISEVQKSGDIKFEDLYRDENDKRIYLTIFIPIQYDKNIIGILAMRIDPELYLYPLIIKWPLQSKTAETLLIRREGSDVVFLNELKFQKNTALNLRKPLGELSLPAAQAAMGKKEFMQGVDYRGVPVLAHVYPVPNSPWFLVARIDISEVYASLREVFWVIIIFVVVLLTGLGASVGLIWRNQHSKFHKERNLSTESIRRLNRVYAVLRDINESIVRIRNPQELFEKACDIAIEKGEFQMAWIGKINSQTKKIDLVASKGVPDGHLKKINFYYGDDESQLGIAGRAIENGVHVISNDIQNDENILPLHKESVLYGSKSSAAFPLKVLGKVWGVFKLYSSEIGFFDEEEIELLDELAMDISFAIEVDGKETERKHAVELLTNSESRYRRLFESAKDGILILDAETGKIVDVNPFLTELLGYLKENFIGKEIWEIGFFKDVVANHDKFLELQQKKYVRYENLPLEASNGRKINVEFVSNVYLVDHQKVIQCNIRDITERKHAEKKLQESEEKYRSFFENSIDAILLTSPDGRIFSANPAACRLFGYSEEEFTKLGRSGVVDITDPNLPVLLEVRAMTGKANGELTFIRKSGTRFLADISSAIFKNQEGLERTSMIIRDITERKRAENALNDSRENLSLLLNSIAEGAYGVDTNGNCTFVNRAFLQILGYQNENELIGKHIHELIHHSHYDGSPYPSHECRMYRVHNTCKATNVSDEVFWRKDGVPIPIEYWVHPIVKEGEVIGSIATFINITERKKAEQKVRESEKRFKAIFDQAPISIALLDFQGYPIISNLPLSKMVGYSSDELAKMKFTDFTYPEDVNKDWTKFVELIEGKISQYGMEKRFVHKNGNLIWVNLIVRMVRDESGIPKEIIGMAEDITKRKHNEEEILMLAQSLKSVNECVSITDMEDTILFVNESFCETYGYNENELIGENMTIIRSLNNPPDLVKEILPATIRGGWQGELWNKRKDGSEFLIYLSTTMIKDKDSNSIGLIGVAKDITKFKRNEIELIEAKERAEQSDKLKTEFLNQMSHEIRSPMNAVVSFANLLREDLEGKISPELTEYINGIDSAGKRLIRTVDLILNVSEMQVGTYEPSFGKFDLLKEIIVKIKNESMMVIESKGLKFNFSSILSEAVIFGDQYSIHQIILNLIDNAIKYTKKGYISISVFKNEQGINVSIEDTGIGMSEEFIEMMYHPFMQEERGNSRRYDGSGLGLSLVKKYCELNGITIEVESKKGIGSKFTLIFTSTE